MLHPTNWTNCYCFHQYNDIDTGRRIFFVSVLKDIHKLCLQWKEQSDPTRMSHSSNCPYYCNDTGTWCRCGGMFFFSVLFLYDIHKLLFQWKEPSDRTRMSHSSNWAIYCHYSNGTCTVKRRLFLSVLGCSYSIQVYLNKLFVRRQPADPKGMYESSKRPMYRYHRNESCTGRRILFLSVRLRYYYSIQVYLNKLFVRRQHADPKGMYESSKRPMYRYHRNESCTGRRRLFLSVRLR